MNAPAAAAATTAVTKATPKDFPAMLETFKGEIARALPNHLNADRMLRIALTEFRKSPKLGECDPKSVFASIIIASQLGIEPGINGQGYLIPYKRECQFVPGWKGLVDLVNRAGRASVWTGAVFPGDFFDYELGDKPFIKHRPGDCFDEKQITHVYAVGRVKGAEFPVIEVWPMKKVGEHLERYNKVGDKHYAYENREMYGRKVALLQVLKYMPQSVELQRAISLEYGGMKSRQNFDVKDAIEGTWVPNTEDDGDNSGTDQTRADQMKDKLRAGNNGAQNGAGTATPPVEVSNAKSIKIINDQTNYADVERAWAALLIDYKANGIEPKDIPNEVHSAYTLAKEKFTDGKSQKL